MSDIFTIEDGQKLLDFMAIKTADGTPLASGTVNIYIKALSGANSGKWYRNSDSTWQTTETANAMTVVGSYGLWNLLLTNSPFSAGVYYGVYAIDSGNTTIPFGKCILCDHTPSADANRRVDLGAVAGTTQTARDLGANLDVAVSTRSTFAATVTNGRVSADVQAWKGSDLPTFSTDAQQYNTLVLASSPQGFWPLDSINTTSDLSGNTYNLANTGFGFTGTSLTADAASSTGSLDASFRSLANATFPGPGTSDFSMEVWFRNTDGVNTQVLMGAKTGTAYWMGLEAGNVKFSIGASDNLTTPGVYTNGIHHAAAVVRTIGGHKWQEIWIDGSMVATRQMSSDTINLNQTGLGISRFEDGSFGVDAGYVSKAAFYYSALNPGAIKAHYATGKPPYSIVDTTINGQAARIYVPVSYDGKTAADMVLYHHGAGETATTIDLLKQGIIHRLTAAGIFFAACTAHGDNWGNDAGIADYFALDSYMYSNYSIRRTVLFGQSMGGLSSLNSLRMGGTYRNCVGWVGIYPVCSLSSLYNNAIYTASVKTAYGIAPDGSDYAAKTAGHDPLLATASDYPSTVPYRFYASNADTTAVQSANTDPMRTLLTTINPPENSLVECIGDHGDPSHFQPNDFLQFVARTVEGSISIPAQKTLLAGTLAASTGTQTLLGRLTGARAGYLDNLSAGAVATAAAISTSQAAILAKIPANFSNVTIPANGTLSVTVAAYASGMAPLQPTVPGRTLNVSASGQAGINWGDVANQGATVNLTNTTIPGTGGGGGGGVAGSGADACTMTIQRTGTNAPIADADVWISSTPDGSVVVAGTLQTDSNGNVTFMLDAGDTYYLWMQKDGENSIRGQQFTAEAD